jgi:hypothetical protein
MTLSRVKKKDAQDDCLLFKLAPETRNEIYALVFAIKTQDDGSVKIEDMPDHALTRTCQQIYDESHKMYKSTSRNYPDHTITIDVLDRKEAHASLPYVSADFFEQMTAFRINWRADEHNKGKPLRFTSHFEKSKPGFHIWRVRVELHDEYWLGEEVGKKLVSNYRILGWLAVYGHSHFRIGVAKTVYAGQEQEELIWKGFSPLSNRRGACY